jgi:hypothetical protein
MTTFAETLALQMQCFKNAKALTLGELARRTGGEVSKSYLCRLLKDEREPSFRVTFLLARGLELDQWSPQYRRFFRSAGYYVPPPPWEAVEEYRRGTDDYVQVDKKSTGRTRQAIKNCPEVESALHVTTSARVLARGRRDGHGADN